MQIAPGGPAGDACIEIILPAGVRIRVPRGACQDTLGAVLGALERFDAQETAHRSDEEIGVELGFSTMVHPQLVRTPAIRTATLPPFVSVNSTGL